MVLVMFFFVFSFLFMTYAAPCFFIGFRQLYAVARWCAYVAAWLLFFRARHLALFLSLLPFRRRDSRPHRRHPVISGGPVRALTLCVPTVDVRFAKQTILTNGRRRT